MDYLLFLVGFLLIGTVSAVSLCAAMIAQKGNLTTQKFLLDYMETDLEFSRTVLRMFEEKGDKK